MTDFPRGWTYNTAQNASGVAASITVPAIPGVVRVLDSLWAKVLNFGSATAFGSAVAVQLNGSGINTLLTQLAASGVSGANQWIDSVSFSGLDIASQVGGQILVVYAVAAGAGIWEEITIQGHDI